MTDRLRAAAEAALEALEYHVAQTRPIQKTLDAIDTLRAALAEPYADKAAEVNSHRIRIDPVTGDVGIGTAGFGKQEPVAWVGWSDVHGYLLWDTKDEAEWMSASDFVPIPVPSPRREWHGLTDDERKQFAQWVHPDVLERVEAALKERNT